MKRDIVEVMTSSLADLTRSWNSYKRLYDELLSSDVEMEIPSSTIARFPKLKTVQAHSRLKQHGDEVCMIDKPYQSSLFAVDTRFPPHRPRGVKALRQLLLSTLAANTEVKVLIAGPLS